MAGFSADREWLHKKLDELLDKHPPTNGPATDEAAKALWEFMADLSCPRGLPERYDEAGEKARQKAGTSRERPEDDDRNMTGVRMYQLAVLLRVIEDVTGLGYDERREHFLPHDFRPEWVGGDVRNMLEDAKNAPLIFRNRHTGNNATRQIARRIVVEELCRRHARGDGTWEILRGRYGDIPQETWTEWKRAAKLTKAQRAELGRPQRSDEDVKGLVGFIRETSQGRGQKSF